MGSLTSNISDKIASGEIKTDGYGNVIRSNNQTMTEDSRIKEQRLIDKKFEEKFGGLGSTFRTVQQEQYELFKRKMLSYGKSNIALGTNMETQAERDFALLGVTIKLNDKLSRLKNLQINKGDDFINDENLEDTIIDIANYGAIALMVRRNEWR